MTSGGNVRKPDRHVDRLWIKGTWVMREDTQYQWAVCIFEETFFLVGIRSVLKSIDAWCPNAPHAVGWAKRNCIVGQNQLVLVKRAPFWTKIHRVDWRALDERRNPLP